MNTQIIEAAPLATPPAAPDASIAAAPPRKIIHRRMTRINNIAKTKEGAALFDKKNWTLWAFDRGDFDFSFSFENEAAGIEFEAWLRSDERGNNAWRDYARDENGQPRIDYSMTTALADFDLDDVLLVLAEIRATVLFPLADHARLSWA
ncbi:hypothetical protein HLH33_00580 [Gluconacetobacter diazotrophicus]|uniref:Uncharacterized protein n=1 Tax=Gluconacetobacter diazotrophicus TaxID=33996 RepID=A0A7W4I3I6_GLUDI|nr:hypothetical protein [Gluconacetobacter diazotrophicus]MBB2154816.1 hypothetical protein [Gluconacetobacter diazotrophicus]